MSDSNVSTVQLLVKELKDVVDDWRVFGVSLGVPTAKLDSIKLDDPNGGVENWKLKMFQFWLQFKVDASWKDVVRALKENNYLKLATTLSREYLLAADSNEEQDAISKEEIKAEIRADADVVKRLRDLEISFTNMLIELLRLLTKCECDLSEAQFFLDDQFETKEFSQCSSFNALLRQLRQGHVDTFNTYNLQQLVVHFKKDELIKCIEDYEAKRDEFLKETTIIEFQHAVISRVEPIKSSRMTSLTILVSKQFAVQRTLKDIQELALRGFGNCRDLVSIHVKFGSVIISWFFPEVLSDKLEYLAHKNAGIFKEAGVEKVTIGGKTVFSSTLEEDIPTASLKEMYTDFYHRLVEAVSDEHTCQSLLAQLSYPALISEEKITQLTPSRASGRSFLKTLGLEEEPRLLVPLVIAMSGVKQLQTLAGEMSAVLRSNQGASEKEEKNKLKQLYTEFYQQLVEAVSDPDTCHSLTTQLHSTSLLSEEKKAVLSSSLASGSSFLKVLGVEEEPHLLTVLMEKMSAVKQLQTLSEDMTAWLSGSKQAQQQLETNVERLTSDKADLLTRLQCYEEDLKTANELLKMREKAISGLMAANSRAIKQKSVTDVAVQTATVKAMGKPLPFGWEKHISAKGLFYYVDHNTQTTHWEPPSTIESSFALPIPACTGMTVVEADCGVMETTSQWTFSDLVSDNVTPLPAGWEERRRSSGDVFFVDHNNKVTQWLDPRNVNQHKENIKDFPPAKKPSLAKASLKRHDQMVTITIKDETFSILEVPDSNSTLVKELEDVVLAGGDLNSLMTDLSMVGKFTRIAYNGVAGYTDLQIKIYHIRVNVSKLCDKSAITVGKFKKASRAFFVDLQTTYQFVVDGMEDMAIVTLQGTATVIQGMANDADELAKTFEEESEQVTEHSIDTIRIKAIEEERIEDGRKHKFEQTEAAQKQSAAAGQNLDQQYYSREIAITSLHRAMGGLKGLSTIMRRISIFWTKLKLECYQLGNQDITAMIKVAMKMPKEERAKIWGSIGFKTKAVYYYARWVALANICGAYYERIKVTQNELYDYLEENLTTEEARRNVQQLAATFSKELEEEQKAIAEKEAQGQCEMIALTTSSEETFTGTQLTIRQILTSEYVNIHRAMSLSASSMARLLYSARFISESTHRRVTENIPEEDKADKLLQDCKENIITHAQPVERMRELLKILCMEPSGRTVADKINKQLSTLQAE